MVRIFVLDIMTLKVEPQVDVKRTMPAWSKSSRNIKSDPWILSVVAIRKPR